MASKNLWPSKATVLNLGENAPSTILVEQAELLKDFDPSVYGDVKEASSASGTLSSYMFEDAPLNAEFRYWGNPNSGPVAFKLSAGRKNISFKFDIVMIKFNETELYPVEVLDVINNKKYSLPNRVEFENCLRDIFCSPECLKKLRFLLKL